MRLQPSAKAPQGLSRQAAGGFSCNPFLLTQELSMRLACKQLFSAFAAGLTARFLPL